MRRIASLFSSSSAGRVWLSLLLFVIGGRPYVQAAVENPVERVLKHTDSGELKLQAEAGEAAAQELYGGRLESAGFHAEAVKWYRRSAEAGRPEAQYRLGLLLLRGRPGADTSRPAMPAQPGAGIKWLEDAANQNHAPAQLQLGHCYLEGIGVSPNPVEAYKWFLLAADQTLVACGARDRTALVLSVEQLQKAQAQAQAFRAGDRRDPRIRIVTKADLASTNIVDTVRLESHPVTPEPAATVEAPATAAAVEPARAPGALEPAATIPPRLPRPDPFAEIQQLIVRLVALGALGTLGLIAFAIRLLRLRSRRVTKSSITGRPLPPPLPASPS